MEGDHVHLGLPFDFPFDNEIQFDIAFNIIQLYIFLKKPYSSKNSLNAPQHSSPPVRTRNVDIMKRIKS